jgi:hypothetical protein
MLDIGAPRDIERVVVTVEPGPQGKELAIWWTETGFVFGKDAPSSSARLIVSGKAITDSSATKAAALGCVDAGGMFTYAQVATEADPAADRDMLVKLSVQLQCEHALLLEEPLSMLIGGSRDLAGHPRSMGERALRLVRGVGPGARRFMEDTPIVGPMVWGPLQRKRVRYFRKPNKETESSSESETTSSTEPSE